MQQQPHLGHAMAPFAPDETLVAVVEMSRSTWLVAGLLPGVDRRPLKKLSPNEEQLGRLLEGWRDECLGAGLMIKRVVVAYEAGRDGFWLARWMRELAPKNWTDGLALVLISAMRERTTDNEQDPS